MAFQQGLSGLNAAAKNLDVIGHNIANSETTGFKASRTEFSALVASAIGASGSTGTGIGVEVADVAQQFQQGTISVTGNNLDLAINGDGFFVVQQSNGTTAYTRAGNFQLDKDGNLVTNTGEQVMGYTVNPDTGLASSTPVPLTFPTNAPIQARQTTDITMSYNLDARTPINDGTTPRTTYGTSLNVYDSQGVATPESFYFDKTGANSWDIYTSTDDTGGASTAGRAIFDNNGDLAATLQPITGGAVGTNGLPTSFAYTYTDGNGVIQTTTVNFADDTDAWNITVVDPTTTPPTVTAQLKPDLVTYDPATGDSAFSDGQTVDATTNTGTPANPAAFNLALTVNPSPANPNSPNATPGSPAPNPFQTTLDLSGMTQYGTSFAPIELSQDGYTAGELTNISVGSDGMITASYSNGVTRAESQVALASFRNVQGLIPVGDNDWIASNASGPAVFGAAGSGVFGSLQSGALEDSNVDLTNELVNMMTAQRAYQANAQTIKTQDQVFSTLVNLR